jgi:hypothetical protein
MKKRKLGLKKGILDDKTAIGVEDFPTRFEQ